MNIDKFNTILEIKGYTKIMFCNMLNITRPTLDFKLKNNTFTIIELKIIQQKLNLSNLEIINIFFN